MPFDFDTLKDLLVCPQSKAPLVLDGETLVSTDAETRLCYPIKDDIPIMLVEEATELSPDEWTAIMQRNGQDVGESESSEN